MTSDDGTITVRMRPQFARLLLGLVRRADPMGVFCREDATRLAADYAAAIKEGLVHNEAKPSVGLPDGGGDGGAGGR
jgi:hypothetical protein